MKLGAVVEHDRLEALAVLRDRRQRRLVDFGHRAIRKLLDDGQAGLALDQRQHAVVLVGSDRLRALSHLRWATRPSLHRVIPRHLSTDDRGTLPHFLGDRSHNRAAAQSRRNEVRLSLVHFHARSPCLAEIWKNIAPHIIKSRS